MHQKTFKFPLLAFCEKSSTDCPAAKVLPDDAIIDQYSVAYYNLPTSSHRTCETQYM